MKTMKKILLIILFFLSGFSALFAQERNEDNLEKIKALKIAFITQKLNLSAEEAEKFWPIYNQYEREVRGINRGDVLQNEEQLLNTRKKYKSSFERVLGPQKLNKLFNAERDFRDVLIRRLKDRPLQKSGRLRR